MELGRSITINRPPDQVFAFVSDSANNRLWQPEVIENKMITDEPMTVGSRVHHVSKFMGRQIESDVAVTEFVPNRKIAFHAISGTLPYTIYYLLDSEGNGTHFTYSTVMESSGLLKLAEPLIRMSAKRVIEGDLSRLKIVLESQNP